MRSHPWRSDAGNMPHIRSFSVDSSLSVSSIAESLQDMDIPNLKDTTERPPPLHLGILKSYSAEASPTRSFESYLPSPAGSDTFSHDGTPINPFQVDYHETRLHTRNESYSGGLRNTNRVELWGKKSMPDLRTAKLNFEELSSDFAERDFSADTLERDQNNVDFFIPSDPLHQQDSHSSVGSDSVPSRSVTREGVRSGTSIALECDVYFRGLSTPHNGAPLPKAALCLIDSARSILFALSQAYETLEQCAVNTADDRLSSVLKKVLDPACAHIMHLINALVRFDVTSRKAAPSPAVCRGVLENCKDSVAVFSKAVAVLSLQLRVITTGNDVRHSRWILLELNAATVEISCAWQAIIRHMDAIKPLLGTKAFPTQSPLFNASIPDFHTVKGAGGQPSPVLRPYPAGLNSTKGSVNAGRVRTARRHAGSFSSKDVEIGKKLPSYEDIPGTFSGVVSGLATHTPTLRPLKRQATAPLSATSVAISSSSPTSSMPLASISSSLILPEEASTKNHSRQESHGSLHTSSSSSSPSAPSKPSFLDLPFNSKAQVDKEALQAVQATVDIASDVWDMIEDTLGGVVEATETIRATLEIARAVTSRLSDIVRSMQSVDPAPTDRKSLREDARVFLKVWRDHL
jgi:RAM signalling pathway protein